MLNQYAIELRGYNDSTTAVYVMAKTAAKAKYLAWLDYADVFNGFKSFLLDVCSCRKLPQTFETESFQRMKHLRDIPFVRIGMKVEMFNNKTGTTKAGTIVGSNSSCNLDVIFDGETRTSNCHPYSNIRYLDDSGKIIKEYKEA